MGEYIPGLRVYVSGDTWIPAYDQHTASAFLRGPVVDHGPWTEEDQKRYKRSLINRAIQTHQNEIEKLLQQLKEL